MTSHLSQIYELSLLQFAWISTGEKVAVTSMPPTRGTGHCTSSIHNFSVFLLYFKEID